MRGVQLPFRVGTDLFAVWASSVLQLRLPRDHHNSDIAKRYTGARDTTFARSAGNNWIPKRDGYIHTNYFRDATQN